MRQTFLTSCLRIGFVFMFIDFCAQTLFSGTQPYVQTQEESMHQDPRNVFRIRKKLLKEKCLHTRGSGGLPVKVWLDVVTLRSPGPLEVCVPWKVGSSSWRQLIEQINNMNISSLRPVSAMQVRHPLSRLTSGYRDKYLNGAPISSYTSEWQTRTRSKSTWLYRWVHYWLPTLISSKRVEATQSFLRIAKRNAMAFRFISENHRRDGEALVLPLAHSSGFDEPSFEIGTLMMANGRQVGMEDAIRQAYGNVNQDLATLHGNATFSFVDFLHFLVWSNDLGVLDQHWTPYADYCFPCLKDYQYILHLETISEEVEILLKDAGYPESVRFPQVHRLKGLTRDLSASDVQYFKGVPKSLFKKIVKIYEADFELFGYSKSIFES